MPTRNQCEQLREQVAAYERDGAVVLRGAVPRNWLTRMERALERVLRAPGPAAVEYAAPGRGRYFNEAFVWLRDGDFRDFMHEGPLPELASSFLSARQIGLFFDQAFVKEPGTIERTPWHQDLPFWPVREPNLVTFWVPLDPVTRDSGAIVYIKGSHRWGRAATRWTLSPNKTTTASGFDAASVRPEELHGAAFIHWDVEPGDVIVHHPLTVHAAFGNTTRGMRRRAIAARYYGEGCSFHARPDHILEVPRIKASVPPADLAEGQPLGGPLFPVVWSTPR